MAEKKTYGFGEKKSEWSKGKQGYTETKITAKYLESKKKATELIEDGKFGLLESDFWILKNEDKSGEVYYQGLIISHNGCLKINAGLPPELRYKAECITAPEVESYTNGRIMKYVCPEQGLYEIGEISASNCKNGYPYAMLLKRLLDRVILKLSQIGFNGIYNEGAEDGGGEDTVVVSNPDSAAKKSEGEPAAKPEADPETGEIIEEEPEMTLEQALATLCPPTSSNAGKSLGEVLATKPAFVPAWAKKGYDDPGNKNVKANPTFIKACQVICRERQIPLPGKE